MTPKIVFKHSYYTMRHILNYRTTYKYFLVVFSVVLVSLSGLGCGTPNINSRIENIVPRDAFVRIIAEAKAEICFEDPVTKKTECKTSTMKAFASGAIVHRKGLNSKILTAGHVCDTDDLTEGLPHLRSLKIRLLAIAANGEVFETKILRIDKTIDCCLLLAENMNRWKPIRIRTSEPKYGEVFYNLASPLGTATNEMTPFLQGRYAGMVNFKRAAYMIPAAPGSSGSPIFDKRGKLVGMIHSVYIRFPMLSFSPTHGKLLEFLDH